MAVNVGDLFGRIRFDTSDLDRGVARATAKVGELDKSFLRIQRDVQQAASAFRAGKISVQDYGTALEFARAEAQALRSAGIKPVGAELNAFRSVMRSTGETVKSGATGIGSLRSAMGSLAFTAAGMPGRLGEVSSMLSTFAVGSLASAGIFAGLAGIALAFRKITEASRESKERIDDFVKSSESFKRAQTEQQLAESRARQGEIMALLAAGGRTRTREIGGPQGGRTRTEFEPLSDRESLALRNELAGISRAFQDAEAPTREFAASIAELRSRIVAVAPRGLTPDELLFGPRVMGGASSIQGRLAASDPTRRGRTVTRGMDRTFIPDQFRRQIEESFGKMKISLPPDALRKIVGPEGFGSKIGGLLKDLGGGFASLISPVGLLSLGLGALGVNTEALQKVMGKVINVLIKMVTAPLRLLAKIPFIGKPFKKLVQAFDKLTTTADGTGKDVGGLGAAARDATEALRNVPTGVKVSLERFRAISTAVGGGRTGSGIPQHESTDPFDQQANRDFFGARRSVFGPGSIVISGVSDPAEAARQVIKRARSEFLRGGVTDLDLIGAEGLV